MRFERITPHKLVVTHIITNESHFYVYTYTVGAKRPASRILSSCSLLI